MTGRQVKNYPRNDLSDASNLSTASCPNHAFRTLVRAGTTTPTACADYHLRRLYLEDQVYMVGERHEPFRIKHWRRGLGSETVGARGKDEVCGLVSGAAMTTTTQVEGHAAVVLPMNRARDAIAGHDGASRDGHGKAAGRPVSFGFEPLGLRQGRSEAVLTDQKGNRTVLWRNAAEFQPAGKESKAVPEMVAVVGHRLVVNPELRTLLYVIGEDWWLVSGLSTLVPSTSEHCGQNLPRQGGVGCTWPARSPRSGGAGLTTGRQGRGGAQAARPGRNARHAEPTPADRPPEAPTSERVPSRW
ncbi:hypothetical protein SAMN05444320_10613 [Streptoalloteichus hindustanus]|uniref:Uncharacterized protein n=1 Tax=Streptoalloteichus hindustanus TaxID=2017 RepID=A0A1M5G8E9_STRHI|nr:hypothetical protein SAMN05444320_10613 [Streptoalloteichus hindustanus]